MRHYETIFIIIPDLPDEERQAVVDRYRKILDDQGAEVLFCDDWGRRKLAYDIRKFSKGHYILFEYVGTAPAVSELERNLRLDDKILRLITVKKAEVFDREAFEANRAKAARTIPSETDEAPAHRPGDWGDRPRGRGGDDDEGGWSGEDKRGFKSEKDEDEA